MAVGKLRGDKKKCNDLAFKIIRRDGVCQRCGSDAWLQPSHIISRTYSATFTDLDNIQCLCGGCHMYFTKWPREFSHWITDTIGSEKYEALKAQALDNVGKKFDWDAELARLKAEAERLGL